MKYTGRIALITLLAVLVAVIKTVAYYQYHIPLTDIPRLFLPAIFLFWWLGWNYDKVRFLSEKDVLTKLYNRGYVLKAFPAMLAKAKRKPGSLALFYLDVDDFKAINDTYGHEQGDKVLHSVSAVLLNQCAPGELAARWSGDEFILLAPSQGAREAQEKMDRIGGLLKAAFADSDSGVTVSIGTAFCPEDGQGIDDLLRAADRRMYERKAAKSPERSFRLEG